MNFINRLLNTFVKQTHRLISLLMIGSVLLSGCGDINVVAGDPEPEPDPVVIEVPGNQLTALSLSEINLSPVFSESVLDYTATVAFTTENIEINAVAEDGASITINGDAFVGSVSLGVEVGSNLFTVVVSGNEGDAVTYTITVTKEAGATNANLSALVLSAGSYSPDFSADVTEYSISVASDVSTMTVTPTSADNTATIRVNDLPVISGAESGSIELGVDLTTITVALTAQDGDTQKAYIITVERAEALSDNADLVSLTLSTGSLTPTFDPATLSYTASVDFATSSITVTPNLAFGGADVTINGTLVNSGTASNAIDLLEGENTITAIVLAEDGVTTKTYNVVVTRQAAAIFAQEAYIKASNSNASDQFGYSVAVSGQTMVIGSYFEASNAVGINGDQQNNDAGISGAVYVFVRDNGVWTQQAYLKSSNSEANDEFGYSVAIDGDRLVVGARGEDSSATGVGGDQTDNGNSKSGAAYVFARNNGEWTQVSYLKPGFSQSNAQEKFGSSVAISGDFIVVGAPGDDRDPVNIGLNQSDTGVVYLFRATGGVWINEYYFNASNADEGDQFGEHVAIDGLTFIVSASFEDSNATGVNGDEDNNEFNSAGAVYVFAGEVQPAGDILWTQQAYLKASNTARTDGFGTAIDISGDTIAVGAYTEDSGSTGVNGDQSNDDITNSGAVYLFDRDQGAWSQQSYIKASNPGDNYFFGQKLSLDTNVLAVGGYGERSNAVGIDGDQSDTSLSSAGATYVYTRNNGSWTQAAYVKASNTGSGDKFATDVAVAGSILVITAEGEDSNASGINGDQGDDSANNTGAGYVFDMGEPVNQ